MNQTVVVGYITLALLMVVVTSTEAAGAQQVRGQRMGAAQMTSIRNFRAVDISETELQVTVDYTYAGEAGTSEAYIHAIPQERGGAFDPRTVDVEKIPLSLGDNHVNLTITKRPRSRNFTSESIRVCISAPGRAILCEDFPFTKSWGTAQRADQATRQCLDEVRKAMGREEIEQLDAGDQRKVTEYCELGDVNRATRYVMLIGAYRRCTRALDAHIENNNLDVAKDVRSRAYSICRRGDLQNAIEVVAGSPTQEPAAPAEIISFIASNSKVKKGDSVTLSWQTANANTVMLGRAGTTDFRNVQASGSQSVSPDKTTTYVLMAGQATKGPTKMESKTLQVSVITDPEIFRFYASPSTIRQGLTSKLTWDVYGADRVSLDGTPVSPRGDEVVSPRRTKTYTLTARTGDKAIKEHAKVHVSPFPPPKLSPAFSSVELCRKVDESGESYRCVSPDGPFWRGDEIHVIVRFKNLPRGRHKVERMIYDSGVFGSDKWKRIHREESSFQNTRRGYTEIAFRIPNLGKGVRKLELVLDDKQNTKSDIRYCVECPGHDEW